MYFILPHIQELRTRIIRSIIVFFCNTSICYFFSDEILLYITKSVKNLISIKVFELFITEIKISAFLGLFFSLPYIIWHVWSFIAIGLLKKERKFFQYMVILSLSIFVIGVLLANYFIIPLTCKFLLEFNKEFVKTIISIENYINFFITTLISFGLGFQFPLIIIFLIKINIITLENLKNNRKFVFLAILIISCIITPPDIVSPIILTICIYAIYELVLIFLGKYSSAN